MASHDTRSAQSPPNGLRRIVANLIMPALEAYAASRGSYRQAAGLPANKVVARFERRRRPGTPTGRFDRAMAAGSH
jgi:hypothetical protein